jgi:hypothetical protein
VEGGVGGIKGTEVGLDGPWAVNGGLFVSDILSVFMTTTHVFSRKVGLVEVPGVGHVCSVNGYQSAHHQSTID